MAFPKTRTEDEHEIKIRLSAGDLEKVFNALAKKYGGHIEHKYLPRAYYDTDDLKLYQNNLSLRMQYKEGKGKRLGGYEQTVKSDLAANNNTIAGALFRREVKDMMPGPQPDINAVSDASTAKALAPFAGEKLRHLFTAAIERRYFVAKTGSAAAGPKQKSPDGKVEIAFDVGGIIMAGDGGFHPFHEIELEHKSGDPAALLALRDEILKLAPSAVVQPLSKSQQGCQLYLAARKALPPAPPPRG